MGGHEDDSNSYEAVRRKRVLENLKHLEDLGISKISKSLLDVAKSESKLLKSNASPRSRKKVEITEVRRSSRARNTIPSYRDAVDEVDFRSHRKRYCRSDQSGREYTGRVASYEQQVCAVKNAEKIQRGLDARNPSFVKTMVRSHVSSCFWLGLPSKFCKEHLPPNELKMVLEDEDGLEFDAIYIGSRTGLSGGWRGFAMHHNLEDGDALVFELIKRTRFKIYIIKAIDNEVEAQALDNYKIPEVDAKMEDSDGKESSAPQNPSKVQPALVGAQRRKRRR